MRRSNGSDGIVGLLLASTRSRFLPLNAVSSARYFTAEPRQVRMHFGISVTHRMWQFRFWEALKYAIVDDSFKLDSGLA